jgi:hypothetical protein
MTETALLAETLRLCERYGVMPWHDYGSLRNAPGLPDLILVTMYRAAWRELKSYPGAPWSTAQIQYKYMLKAAGQDYDVWYPRDLESGLIESELYRLSQP